MNDPFAFHSIRPELIEQLRLTFDQNEGIGIGQSGVISKKMHMYLPQCPQHIQIVKNIDAGKLFYGRNKENQIFHLDVFHACGEVDHKKTAQSLLALIQKYKESTLQKHDLPNVDLFDLQTGSGGGRISGTLDYGSKESLRFSHQNHIHLAFSLSDAHLPLLFFIVMELEAVILHSNLELRRLEKISSRFQSETALMDLSDYTAATDSKLREPASLHATYAYCRQKKKSAQPPAENLNALPAAGSGNERGGISIKPREGMRQQTLVCLDKKMPALFQYKSASAWESNQQPISLQQILFKIKKALIKTHHYAPPLHTESTVTDRIQICLKNKTNDTLSSLAIQETIRAAASRQISEQNERFSIQCADLRFLQTARKIKAELCVLLDSSASMSGWRIELAKKLTTKLMQNHIRKISIVSFQDQCATITLPLTHEQHKLQSALGKIQPSGATPLALGMKTSLDYLTKEQVKRPMVLLITDGLPCYASGNLNNPLDDALHMAKQLKKNRIPFICLGLSHDQGYLFSLAKAAGGKALAVGSK